MAYKCEFCFKDLKVCFVDIGGDDEPIFLRTLTCSCEEWLQEELEYTDEMSQKYGEVI